MASFTKTVASPVGALQLVATARGLAAVLWDDERADRVRTGALHDAPDHPVLDQAGRELAEYFAGVRTVFSVPLDLHGTAFQRQVWAALLTIPYGETRSYGQIARQVGRPTAFRAVGAANGRNPVSIIAPCHRVVGATGALTGFAGGLARKERLLGLERRVVSGPRDLLTGLMPAAHGAVTPAGKAMLTTAGDDGPRPREPRGDPGARTA